jgi:hypothetical protein
MIIERRAYRWLASPIRSIVHGRQIPESLVPKECEHPRPSQLSKKNKTIASQETGASASFRKEGIPEMSRNRSCHRYFPDTREPSSVRRWSGSKARRSQQPKLVRRLWMDRGVPNS